MPILFVNHDFIDANAPSILATDRGLLLGDGLFETIRAYSGKTCFLQQHWERLTNSAKILEIKFSLSFSELLAIIRELLTRNHLENQDARIRVTLTRGSSKAGLATDHKATPTLVITATSYTLPEAIHHIIISNIRRNEFSPLANLKSLNYLDNILALQEAQKQNADEALLLNTQGNLACATTGNIFIVKQETIYTPRLADGALPGIMRSILIQLAHQHKIKLTEATINLSQLQNAEELFLSNSLVGIRPIVNFQESVIVQNVSQHMQQILQEYILTCR